MRVTIFLAAMAAAAAVAADDTDILLQERLRAHIEFLADDQLKGRQPGTPGYDIAAAYVASQFRQMGLHPAGDDGGFYQDVPLRRSWLEEGSAEFVVMGSGGQHELVFVDDFYMAPSKSHLEADLEAGLVFAGYGIDAPALDYSDYENIDVNGKVVVYIGGQPHDFPSEEGAHFASGREKTRAALEHGAIGIIRVYTPRNQKRYTWDRVGNLVGMPAMGWLDSDGEVFASPHQIQAEATIHFTPAERLFEGARVSLSDILAADDAAEPLPAFDLPTRVQLRQRSRHEQISSPNVVAVLPGSDPTLSGEYLVYTAHLDHIGELHGSGHDDAINNGALDNAAGTAVMLETAREFAGGPAPRRSILFLSVTAEEKGLVGSEYFARNPTVPVESLVGVINLDMPLLLYDFADVIAFGAGHSDFGSVVDQAAAEAGIVQTPDPFPDQNVFVRSDHYRFVQRGIPSIFLVTGMKDRSGELDVPSIVMGFRKEHYHRPSDSPELSINYSAGARFTRINKRIGEIVADRSQRPQWHEGDFFGETFAP